MSEKSSRNLIGYVLKIFFENFKPVYIFYTAMIVALFSLSLIASLDSRVAGFFELSAGNPFGIILSIFAQNSLSGFAVNVFSTYLIVFAFTSSSSLLKFYGFSLKGDPSKYLIVSPTLSSLIANAIAYGLVAGYSLQSTLSGFHVMVQSLLGFTSVVLLYMFLVLRGFRRLFYPLSLIILFSLALYLFYGLYALGLENFIFDFQKILSLTLGLSSGTLTVKRFG